MTTASELVGAWLLSRWDYTVDGVFKGYPNVEFSLFPNWVGTDLVREISWDGDRLVLTGVPEVTSSGRTVVNRLFWHRVAPATEALRKERER